MTISRECGIIVFQCDGKRCPEIFDSGERDFNIALEDFKKTDWTIRNINGEWFHICPDCQEAENALAL